MSYNSKYSIDIRDIRKRAAAATGMHGAFSKKKEHHEPQQQDLAAVNDELELKRVCEITRIEDLQQRIPPIAGLLKELAGSAEAPRDVMNELATELKAWTATLDEAITDFDLGSDDLKMQEKQLQVLSDLREQVTEALDLYESPVELKKPATKETATATADLIRWSAIDSFATHPTATSIGRQDPFALPQDPFAVPQQQQQEQQQQQQEQQQLFFDPFAQPKPAVTTGSSPTSTGSLQVFAQSQNQKHQRTPAPVVFDPFAAEDPFGS